MKEVDFIINGAGLGNSTRCDSVIEHLNDLERLNILCSNNSYKYFSQKNDPRIHITNLKGYQYSMNKNGNISFVRTLFKIPIFLWIYIKNFLIIKKVLDRSDSNIVITDSDYSFVFLRFLTRKKYIAINNASYVMKNIRLSKAFIFKDFPQFMIEVADYLVHKFFAHVVICPTFTNVVFQEGKTFYVPPLVRSSFFEKRIIEKSGKVRVGVIPSGSAISVEDLLGKDLLRDENFSFFIPETLDVKGTNIENFKKFENSSKVFNAVDLIICNAGMSCLSEVYVSGIPALVIPIKGHIEQVTNALVIRNEMKNINISFNGGISRDDVDSLPRNIISNGVARDAQVSDLIRKMSCRLKEGYSLVR